MKYHELKTESHKAARRVGRGIAAGQGKTAGRGTKGQRSRAGSGRRPGFAGGQNPLMQKLPKLPGFKSFRPRTDAVYTGQLDALKLKIVDNNALAKAGLVASAHTSVKLLVKGDVKSSITVKLQGASQAAVEALQKSGGNFEKTARIGQPQKNKAGENKS